MKATRVLVGLILVQLSACGGSEKKVDIEIARIYENYFSVNDSKSKLNSIFHLRKYIKTNREKFHTENNYYYAYGLASARLACLYERLSTEQNEGANYEKIEVFKQEAVRAINKSVSEKSILTWNEVETLLSEFKE